MDAGKLKERIKLLELGGDCHWRALRPIWGSADHRDKTNIFAKSGFGAATVEFIIRKQAVTLHNAIRWNGLHCMITAIAQQGSRYIKLTTAVICLYECTATRPIKTTKSGKPCNRQEPLGSFQATLTEKYQRGIQEQPQTVLETTRILVTPKAVQLAVADLVTIGADTYVVVAAYTLATHCNEYEILDRREV